MRTCRPPPGCAPRRRLSPHGGQAVDAAARRLLSAEQLRCVVAENTRFTSVQDGDVMLTSRSALQAELAGLLSTEPSPRNRAMIARYLGWDGAKPATFEQVGRQYGLTRERIRQICARFTKQLPAATTPVLDRCLAVAAVAAPSDA